MPRSRELKYGFFTDEEVAQLGFAARLLFQGMWCLADRDGRLEDRPMRIKAMVFPYDSVDIDALLAEVARASGRFIERYEVDGKRYIQIRTLNKNQHFHPKEKSAGFPPPPAGNFPGKPDSFPTSPAIPSLSSLPSLPSQPSLSSVPSGSFCPETAEDVRSRPDQEPARPAEPSVLSYPCDGKPSEWHLTQSQLDEWAPLFPTLDLLDACRQAKAWVMASPDRRKTAKGMCKFLVNWFGREKNNGRSRASPQQQLGIRVGHARAEDFTHSSQTGEVKL